MIHQTAIIHPHAKLSDNVEVGPWSIIGENVEIGAGTVIGANTVIEGPTKIGTNNQISSFVSIGSEPQSAQYRGEETQLIIGNNNVIREFCTINRGSMQGNGMTTIGDDNFFLAYSHIAHDCSVGNKTTFVNNATLGGHVRVGDYAYIGCFVCVHQFCEIGSHSIISHGSVITKDVLACSLVAGNPPSNYGINLEGLKRRGFSKETISELKRAQNVILRQGLTTQKALSELKRMVEDCSEIQLFIDSLQSSSRGIIR